jgi:heme-degrading monooxygenase HmoA
MIVRMWEVKGHPELFDDLLSWICEYALPRIEVLPGHVGSEVFSSTDHRVVVISKWRTLPETLADPPRHLVDRPAHAWDFTLVDR